MGSKVSRWNSRQGGKNSGVEDISMSVPDRAERLEYWHPPGDSERLGSLIWFGNHLYHRYGQFGEMKDIQEAIVLGREALDLCPQGHPDRPTSLNNLALYLSARYDRLGAIEDLDDAIILCREALGLCHPVHPHWPSTLNNLALYLSTRYNQFGAIEDLDDAIVLGQEALVFRPLGHPDRSSSLNNLAFYLAIRYKSRGAVEDLDNAIIFGRESLEYRPPGHPDRSSSLGNLANHLITRYDRLGGIEDLDDAIVFGREALVLQSSGHPNRSSSLANLAHYLTTRYNGFGAIEDLDEAIALVQEALDLCPPGHPNRASTLDQFALRLSTRYTRLGAIEDLDNAIILGREALVLQPPGHPHRSISLHNLAIYLSTRSKQQGAVDDLHDAIALVREALDLRPPGGPGRPLSLTNLAIYLYTRYRRDGAVADLNDAISFGREALDLCPPGHPNWSSSLHHLAHYLLVRSTELKRLEDLEEVFNLYAQLVDVPQTVSSADLSAARAWIRASEYWQHPTLLLAYETSLRLLVQHLATLPSLPKHLVILKGLTASLAVDAFSACLRNYWPHKAIELLEQGRGVFWSQLTRLRSPLDDVRACGPAGKIMADQFSRLASRISDALNSPGAAQHDRVYRMNVEMQKVVTDIRELLGLSRFLLPSHFSDLQRAAKGGPVIVVNSSKYTCDALIILLDRDPVRMRLSITQEGVRNLSAELHTLTRRARRGDVTRQLAFFLRKLWDQIVSPIIVFLRLIHPLQSRIWWCPTAEFSQLPLHAAGPFRKGERNLPDLYISSYTPTLTALIRARQSAPSDSATECKRFIAIGQGKAAGESELPSVGVELDAIHQRIHSLATFTRIEGEDSHIARVVEELGKSEWVHLSCHGLPNPSEPFESAFALHDEHFTVQQIIGCDLKNPEFAYLSACHTTVGDKGISDEAIHLAAAMQFAGFRSVIGTMWAVDDAQTSKITSTFYSYMVNESGRLDHTRAAYALNKTMKSVNIPFDQKILYIHLGA